MAQSASPSLISLHHMTGTCQRHFLSSFFRLPSTGMIFSLAQHCVGPLLAQPTFHLFLTCITHDPNPLSSLHFLLAFAVDVTPSPFPHFIFFNPQPELCPSSSFSLILHVPYFQVGLYLEVSKVNKGGATKEQIVVLGVFFSSFFFHFHFQIQFLLSELV